MNKKKGIKIEEILSLHNKGLSPGEIAEKLNCSISNTSRRLKKLNIKCNVKQNKNSERTNRYKVNLNYFEKIDTEEKAYFLGLLYADGSVCKNVFYIKMKDEEILLKLKKNLEAEQYIKKYYYNDNKYSAYVFTVSSQKMAQDLINQGCFINKTYTLTFPTINTLLYSHFIRGFFDGDGSISISEKFSQSRIDFTSASTKFLEQLREILSQLTNTKGSLLKESGKSNAWHLKFGGKHAYIIFNWMYKDASIFMKRKHDKYLIYKNVHVKQGELLENPEVNQDNQQPSLGSNTFEGSTTNSQIQTGNAEDGNTDTSALPFKIDPNGFVTTILENGIKVEWIPIKGVDY